MKRCLSIVLLVVFSVQASGCATVVSGKSQDVMIRSNPTGASILIDGMTQGTTPMVASLIRKERHTIVISKDGYDSMTKATTRGFNWWYLGNLILGGIIGLIVDPITGAIYDIEPDHVYADLEAGTVAEELPQVEMESGDQG